MSRDGTSEMASNAARQTHRLEAFSDIVIGFSLAQLGLSLVIPVHAADFVSRPSGIFAFVVSFAVIVRFWWTNSLIFERYFHPNRLMVTLNFVALASLILQVFSLQLYLHFVPLGEGLEASRIYFSCFALSYGSQGLLLIIGLAYGWRDLSITLRRTGVREAITRFGIVAGAIVGNIQSGNRLSIVAVQVEKQRTIVASLPSELFIDVLIGTALGLLVARFIPSIFRSLREPKRGADTELPGE